MKFFGTLLAALVIFSNVANSASHWIITTEIRKSGMIIGKPVLMVAEHERATIDVTGKDGYQFSVVLTELAQNQVDLKTSISFDRGQSPNKTYTQQLKLQSGLASSININDANIDDLTLSINVFRK